MPVFEAPAVYIQSAITTVSTYFIQHLYLKEYIDPHNTDANFIPLTPTKAFYIRRDNKRRQVVVNVFDHQGNKVYTIERESPLNPVWAMYNFPQRKEIATIRAGFFLKSFDFHNKPSRTHRKITDESGYSGRLRVFYLADGYKYGWTRGSKYLEKFTNPNGEDEEIRERVAKVRLLRQWKFDFEMLIDENKVDPEIALASGFNSMMTQWGVGDITETVGPTALEDSTILKQVPQSVVVTPELPVANETTNTKIPHEQVVPNITVVVNNPNEDTDLIIEKGS